LGIEAGPHPVEVGGTAEAYNGFFREIFEYFEADIDEIF
jgi:hypothetical protein